MIHQNATSSQRKKAPVKKLHSLFLTTAFSLTCLLTPSNAAVVHRDVDGPYITKGADGKLSYKPYTNKGDVIMDFSYAGYKASEVPIPDVPTAVKVELLPGEAKQVGKLKYPVGPDSRAIIQAAINKVDAMPADENGYKGAVELAAGIFYVKGGLDIYSGVVLRGQGDEQGGTSIIFNYPQATAITMGRVFRDVVDEESTTRITDAYVPSGTNSVNVESAHGYAVGDTIRVTRTTNNAWIKFLGMDFSGTDTRPWTPDSFRMNHVREITNIDGNRIDFKIPLAQSFAKELGGGEVTKIKATIAESNMGLEKIRIISNYDPSIEAMMRSNRPYPADEENTFNAGVSITGLNSWVRDCTVMHASLAPFWMRSSRFVTVRDCESLAPVSVVRGGRRYSFSNSGAAMALVYNCHAEYGRHDYVTGARTTGPMAFVRSTAKNAYANSEPHQKWASGVLYDNIDMEGGGGVFAGNRKQMGSGHGWSGVNCVLWNCEAPMIKVENPPTPEQNFSIGSIATEPRSSRTTGFQGDGYFESTDTNVQPDSLFEAQLIDRIGKEQASLVLGL